jgi:elongation factor G
VHAAPLELPTSVFGLAVQPKKRGDEQKVSDVLHKIIAEDPCFRIEHNAQANETVMRGLGEMHLKTVLQKMSTQYKLEPRHPAALRSRSARPSPRAPKATAATRSRPAAPGQFGEVFLKIEPLPRGKGFEFVDGVKGGAIPNQFIPSVEKACAACSRAASSPATRCRT